jgi:hypothetical protein
MSLRPPLRLCVSVVNAQLIRRERRPHGMNARGHSPQRHRGTEGDGER